MFKDFRGKELKVGNSCAYIKNVRTGTSTIRKKMFEGKISGFSEHKIRFENGDVIFGEDVACLDCDECSVKECGECNEE